MNFLPLEDTEEALYNPKFVTNSVVNMDLLEPHTDQKVAMGKMFRSNSRIYRYGKALTDMIVRGASAAMSLQSFTCVGSSAANCISLRPMKAGEYGVFCMLFTSSGGSGGTTDYNNLDNKPMYNLQQYEVNQDYTAVQSEDYRVGDIAVVPASYSSENFAPPATFTAQTNFRFVYCVIDTRHTLSSGDHAGAALFQKCYLGYYSDYSTSTPLHWPPGNDLLTTTTFLTYDDTTEMYDARVLRPVPYNTRLFGWVYLNDYQGDIDAATLQVTAPTDPLPDPTNLRRKNAKKT